MNHGSDMRLDEFVNDEGLVHPPWSEIYVFFFLHKFGGINWGYYSGLRNHVLVLLFLRYFSGFSPLVNSFVCLLLICCLYSCFVLRNCVADLICFRWQSCLQYACKVCALSWGGIYSTFVLMIGMRCTLNIPSVDSPQPFFFQLVFSFLCRCYMGYILWLAGYFKVKIWIYWSR